MRLAALIVLVVVGMVGAATTESFQRDAEAWRTEREAKLAADDGWLTLAGLFWLPEGVTHVGADPRHGVVLPGGGVPQTVARLHRTGKTVRLDPVNTDKLRVNGKAATAGPLRTDDGGAGTPDQVSWGDLTFLVIQRGERLGVRLKDKNSPIRRQFAGLSWFPVRQEARLEGRFTAYPQPRTVQVSTVISGVTETMQAPGVVTFRWEGQEVSLEPVLADGGKRLWFIFRDATSRTETYGGGRFLYADAPVNGKVVLDFNRAYNPPCAFSPYSTCPLPLKRNRLGLAIRAGEKRYEGKATRAAGIRSQGVRDKG